MAGRIVVGVDGSKTAQEALHWAVGEARLRGAVLEVVHGWHYPYFAVAPTAPPVLDRTVLEDAAKQIVADALAAEDVTGVEVERRPIAAPAALALIDRSDDADLVVVGSRGRGGFTGLLLGSVSQQLATHAHCPVVVIRSIES